MSRTIRHIQPRLGLVLIACCMLWAWSGCTIDDGQPWAQVDASLSVEVKQRTTADNRWRTARDYELELTTLSISLVDVRYGMLASGAQVDFDPANPPEGYSLCHNGHCHAADGRLVDYEDIQIELAEASGTGGFRLVQLIERDVDLSTSTASTSVPLGSCVNQCTLPEGTLYDVSVVPGEIRIEGVVYDSRGERLPGEGVPFSASWSLSQTHSFVLNLPVEDLSDVMLELSMRWLVPESLFDGVEFDALLPNTANAQVVLDGDEVFRQQVESRLFANDLFTITRK